MLKRAHCQELSFSLDQEIALIVLLLHMLLIHILGPKNKNLEKELGPINMIVDKLAKVQNKLLTVSF